MEIREHFDSEADSLMGQFEINSNIMYDELLSALQHMFMNESYMLDDNESSFVLFLKKYPERSIAWFFLKVENRTEKISFRYSCKREDALLFYFEKLCQMDQKKS